VGRPFRRFERHFEAGGPRVTIGSAAAAKVR
jgi:hypothetical protein